MRRETVKRVAVLGGSGFVGSRLCEALCADGRYEVTALVRNVGRAARIAQLPLLLVKGDVTNPSTIETLAARNDIIVNLALGGRSGIVNGAKVVTEAARLQGGRCKLVHMSSAAVSGRHGLLWEGTVDETVRYTKTGNDYADAKAAAELVVEAAVKKGLPAVILRPGIVYGPYSFWVERIVHDARLGQLQLVGGGTGIFNGIYVDNLVEAVMCCFGEPAVGLYVVGDSQKMTWRDFRASVAESMGVSLSEVNVPPASVDDLNVPGFIRANLDGLKSMLMSAEFRQSVQRVPAVQALVAALSRMINGWPHLRRRLKPASIRVPSQVAGISPYPMSPTDRLRESGHGRLDDSKARREIGYTSHCSFADAMTITGQWIRHREHLREICQ